MAGPEAGAQAARGRALAVLRVRSAALAVALLPAAVAVVLLAGSAMGRIGDSWDAVRWTVVGVAVVVLALAAGVAAVVVRARPACSPTVPVPEETAPDLYRLVRDLADRLGVPAPSAIALTPDCDSWLEDRTHPAHGARGRRVRRGGRAGREAAAAAPVLVVGSPFLWWMRVAELRALLAPVVAGTGPSANPDIAAARRFVRGLDAAVAVGSAGKAGVGGVGGVGGIGGWAADGRGAAAGRPTGPVAAVLAVVRRPALAFVGWVARLLLRSCRVHAAEMERGVAAAASERAQSVDYGLRIVAQEQVGLAYAGWDRLLTRVALPAWRMGRWPSRLDAGVVAALTELSRRDRLADGFTTRLGERPACDLLEEPGLIDEATSLLAARLFHGGPPEPGPDWSPVAWGQYPEEVVDRKWRQEASRLHRALDDVPPPAAPPPPEAPPLSPPPRGSAAPGTAAAGATSPGAASPGPAPGTAAASAAAPGAAAPGVTSPGAAPLEPASPDAASPGAASLGPAAAGPVSPGAGPSEPAAPGATSSGPAAEGATSSGADSSGAAPPEPTPPGADSPGPASPELSSPDAASSGATSPGARTPARTPARTDGRAETRTGGRIDARAGGSAEVRTDGRTEAREGGWGEARMGGRTEARTDAHIEASTDARMEASADARTGSRTDAPTEAGTDARTEARTDAYIEASTDARTGARTDGLPAAAADGAGEGTDAVGGGADREGAVADAGPPAAPTLARVIARLTSADGGADVGDGLAAWLTAEVAREEAAQQRAAERQMAQQAARQEAARRETAAWEAGPGDRVADDPWLDGLAPPFPLQPPRTGRELLTDHVTAMVCCAAMDSAGASPGLDWLDGPALLFDGVRRGDLAGPVLSLVEDGDDGPLRGWLAEVGVRPEKPVRLV
ncbi:hypothetical protein [Streptomyces varsoviensis]|uniref:hypothetical protein n=1 Tax=Streptomyces varsoviensis TaxID=67373 RepID=UPI0031F81EC5